MELKEYIDGVERIANEARAAGEVGDVGRIVCYVRFIYWFHRWAYKCSSLSTRGKVPPNHKGPLPWTRYLLCTRDGLVGFLLVFLTLFLLTSCKVPKKEVSMHMICCNDISDVK